MMNSAPRGIALLVSLILTTVVLTVALSLLDITYKQVLLASSAKQSQYAFYTADSALECALYFDQQLASFSPGSTDTNISCADNQGNITRITLNPIENASSRTTSFNIPCQGGAPGDIQGSVTVIKMINGTCSGSATTCIYANGYSSCSLADPKRIERGLKVLY